MNNILDYTKYLVNKEYDLQMFFVGSRGAGKSCAAVRFGELFDSTFNIDRVCYTTKEVLNKVKELSESQDGTRGKVIIYDEAGVGIGNRDWQKESNKLMNYFIQQSRVFGLVMIYTAPNLSFVDRQARAMGGVLLRFSMKFGKGVAMPYKVEADEWTGELRTPRFYFGNTLLSYQEFKLPSKKLFQAYKDKSKAQKATSFDLEKMYEHRLTERQKQVWDLHKQGLNQNEIKAKLGVSAQSYISETLTMAKKKMGVL